MQRLDRLVGWGIVAGLAAWCAFMSVYALVQIGQEIGHYFQAR